MKILSSSAKEVDFLPQVYNGIKFTHMCWGGQERTKQTAWKDLLPSSGKSELSFHFLQDVKQKLDPHYHNQKEKISNLILRPNVTKFPVYESEYGSDHYISTL